MHARKRVCARRQRHYPSHKSTIVVQFDNANYMYVRMHTTTTDYHMLIASSRTFHTHRVTPG
jgi:hypothetical protein